MADLDVFKHGRLFDLTEVLEAVEWAYDKSQREDEMFAARNCSDDVLWSPLTRQLETAYGVLLELRDWREPVIPHGSP